MKVFEQSEHAENFRAGNVLARRLDDWRTHGDSHRQDTKEGKVIYQDRIVIPFVVDGNERRLYGTMKDFSFSKWDSCHVLCMTALISHDIDFTSNDYLSDLKRQLDDSLSVLIEMGEHAVVFLEPDTFIRRVVGAAKQRNIQCDGNPVVYYDPTNVTFPLTSLVGRPWHVFCKPNTGTYPKQRELRIAFAGGDSDPLVLNVGSLRDISFYIDTASLGDLAFVFDEEA